MDIETLFLDLLKEHGFWGAMSAVAMYGALHYLAKLDKIVSFISKRNTTTESFNSRVKATVFIQDLLQETIKKIGASRALVILYHNGQHSISGYGFNKMSCVHEVIDSNVNYYGKTLKPILSRFNSIPISAFSLITKKLFTEGTFIIPNVSLCKLKDLSTYEELKYHGAASTVFYPLIDTTKHIFGFISFEFREVLTKKRQETNRIEEEMCVDKVSSVLEYMAKEGDDDKTGPQSDIKGQEHGFTDKKTKS